MSLVFEADFTGATDPALTPVPFDSVTEDGSNDVRRGAAAGVGGTPGMFINYAGGGSLGAYGTVIYTPTLAPADAPGFIVIQMDFKVQANNTAIGNSLCILGRALNAPSTDVATVFIKRSADTTFNYSLQDDEGAGGTVVGTATHTVGTYQTLRLVLDNENGKALLYVDGTLDITVTTGLSDFTSIDRIHFGSVK